MEKVKILWSGITGRTGREALQLVKDLETVEIVAGVCRTDDTYYHYDALDQIKEDFDVIVDFSHKDVFDTMLAYALQVKKPIIIGTSGLTDEQVKAYEEAAKVIPVFRGGNFRFEVKKFIDQVVAYAKHSKEDSLELVETHYKTKKIPSETAKVVANRVLKETGKTVRISSFLEYDELINDWRVGDYHCRVVGFKELAEDVLQIATMMKNKPAGELYDLDRLLLERDLTSFLIEAKKETYANANVERVESSRLGSKDYEYKKDSFVYHDTYFGGTQFMGEEVVYIDEQSPKWGMNYYGVTLDSSLSEEAMDKALRPALMQVGKDDILPVRGPKRFENGDYVYTFTVTGTLACFSGVEEIYKNQQLIYQLRCQGGFIE